MSWQEELRQRLVERNAEESAYSGIIEQCRWLQFILHDMHLTTYNEKQIVGWLNRRDCSARGILLYCAP
jgi:hypothetical protein